VVPVPVNARRSRRIGGGQVPWHPVLMFQPRSCREPHRGQGTRVPHVAQTGDRSPSEGNRDGTTIGISGPQPVEAWRGRSMQAGSTASQVWVTQVPRSCSVHRPHYQSRCRAQDPTCSAVWRFSIAAHARNRSLFDTASDLVYLEGVVTRFLVSPGALLALLMARVSRPQSKLAARGAFVFHSGLVAQTTGEGHNTVNYPAASGGACP